MKKNMVEIINTGEASREKRLGFAFLGVGYSV